MHLNFIHVGESDDDSDSDTGEAGIQRKKVIRKKWLDALRNL